MPDIKIKYLTDKIEKLTSVSYTHLEMSACFAGWRESWSRKIWSLSWDLLIWRVIFVTIPVLSLIHIYPGFSRGSAR